jgi:hypothetical protein
MIQGKSGHGNLYLCFASAFATSALILWMGFGSGVLKVLLQSLLIATGATIGVAWGSRRKQQQ